ncbi:MAG TPA: hypothetical protein VGN37_27920 [Actinocatenispora sp.]
MTAEPRLARLDVFVGEWDVSADFPTMGEMAGAVSTFEWTLDGRFLVQRNETPIPEAPDGLMVVAADGDGYTQHYFDSRGVVRVYRMSFDGEQWRLWRDTADFSPLDFRQRFTGRFDAAGDTITGAWETSADGTTWEHDFTLTYRRRAS